jgi:hypothetical protein
VPFPLPAAAEDTSSYPAWRSQGFTPMCEGRNKIASLKPINHPGHFVLWKNNTNIA